MNQRAEKDTEQNDEELDQTNEPVAEESNQKIFKEPSRTERIRLQRTQERELKKAEQAALGKDYGKAIYGDLTFGRKLLFYTSFIFVTPYFNHRQAIKWFNEEKTALNDQLVQIEAKIYRLYELFEKEIDAAKFLLKTKSEREFYAAFSQLRNSLRVSDSTVEIRPLEIASKDQVINQVIRDWREIKEANFEIQSIPLIQSLHESINKIEQEVAHVHKIYANSALEFNTKLGTYPTNVAAAGLKLVKFPIFQKDISNEEASAAQIPLE